MHNFCVYLLVTVIDCYIRTLICIFLLQPLTVEINSIFQKNVYLSVYYSANGTVVLFCSNPHVQNLSFSWQVCMQSIHCLGSCRINPQRVVQSAGCHQILLLN